MYDFDPKKCLPPNLVIDSVDNHLYRIGLCLTTQHTIKRRKFIYKPIIVFTILFTQLIKNIIDLFVRDRNWSIYSGLLFLRLMNMNFHFNILMIIFIGFSISSQIIWFYNYKNDIKPTFLKVFQMMSGFITPNSIGLTNRDQILALIRRTRILFKILIFNTYIVFTIMSLIFCLMPYIIKCTLFEILIFGIPNTLFFTLIVHYVFNTILFHGIYLYILCYYLKLKFRNIGNISSKMKTNIKSIIYSIFDINSEISEYNQQFWSKYFLTFWLYMGSIISIALYMALFKSTILIYKIMLLYAFTVFSLIFLLQIFTASSVNYESNKSYKVLNSLMANNNRYNNTYKQKLNRISINNKIKVRIIYIHL